MNNDKEASTSDAHGGIIHTVQPLRDLESNWEVDLAKNLQDYLFKICSGEITGDDTGPLSVNFAEAALLLQGSIQVYSRKVEYLYSLVLQVLEFISKKSQNDEPETSSVQAEEHGPVAAPAEEDDSFWGFDDVPVDAKNSLDNASCRDIPLNCFVKPPANLVVLEGDCLDASGDASELEAYLLATNDIYRDFILLDSSDAVTVNEFLDGDDRLNKGKDDFVRCSSVPSKNRKSFLSPTRRSGGTAHKLSARKIQDDNFNQFAAVDHGFDHDDCNMESQPTASNDHKFETDCGFSEPRDLDDSDEDEDDPWKPLNPHERGNLKVKPFKRVKPYRRDWQNSKKQIPITKEFPLARLHGPISSELNEVWEARCCASGRNMDKGFLPYYENLRQSLVDGEHRNCGASIHDKDGNEENGYDSGGPDLDSADFDMPEAEYMNEEHFDLGKDKDGGTHYNANDAFGDGIPKSPENLEDLCRSHLDSLLASIAETEKQTALAARVSTWKQRIEQNLEEQDSRPPFDIHEYGQRTLDKLSVEADIGNSMSFTDVVRGQEKHDVARTFSALLQLVNNGNIELERSDGRDDFVCYTSVNPFYVRLLSNDKRREVQLRSSKKRPKSPFHKGKENRSPVGSSPLESTSASTSSQLNCKFSVKLGKFGGIRCTPDGKRRRRSRLVDLNSVG